MATSTQQLGSQIRPFLLDVSRNLDIADGILGVAFMPEGLQYHVYFAEFVGPTMQEFSADAELAEHQFYELPHLNYLSREFQRTKEKRFILDRSEVLDNKMERLIRDPIITLFGGRENIPTTIDVFIEPLKKRYSYLYYIPRDEQSNEAWDTLCHASFLVAQLLWSTLATAMAAGAVSHAVTRPILMCLPRYFPQYDDRIQQMLEEMIELRSRYANVSAYIDIKSQTIPAHPTRGATQQRPYELSVQVSSEGSVPIEVLQLMRPPEGFNNLFHRDLFGEPVNEQHHKQVLAFLLLHKALQEGNDAVHVTWRELLPIFNPERAKWLMPQLDRLEGNEHGAIMLAANVPDKLDKRKDKDKDKKHPWVFRLRANGNRKTLYIAKKDAQDFVRKHVSDADKWLRKQLGVPAKKSLWFVNNKDGGYQLVIPTEFSPPLSEKIARVKSELKKAQSDGEFSDEQTIVEWLRSTKNIHCTDKWLGYMIRTLDDGLSTAG